LRLFSFGGYGLALAALALLVFGAIECPRLRLRHLAPLGFATIGVTQVHKIMQLSKRTLWSFIAMKVSNFIDSNYIDMFLIKNSRTLVVRVFCDADRQHLFHSASRIYF